MIRNVALIAASLGICSAGFGGTVTVSQNVSVQLDSAGKLSAPLLAALVSSGTAFSAFEGSLILSYRFRTAPSGSGAITVRAASDFSPAGGPSVGANVLRYACLGAGLGVACSGMQSISTAAASPVVQIPGSSCTGGGGACSASDPVSVELRFQLENSPEYPTGSYSVPLVFTISTL